MSASLSHVFKDLDSRTKNKCPINFDYDIPILQGRIYTEKRKYVVCTNLIVNSNNRF